jgi:hypothetical protein
MNEEGNKKLTYTDENSKKEIIHSDDEVSVRRGLDPSTFRS